MNTNFSELDPDIYVRAAHFNYNDDAALFGALAAIDRAVELVIIEDPENPLLRRHAELRADYLSSLAESVEERFPSSKFAEMSRAILEGVEARKSLVESELMNFRAILSSPGMGLFAVYGARADVDSFIEAHISQPFS